MKRLTTIFLFLATVVFASAGQTAPQDSLTAAAEPDGEVVVTPLQKRDSILVGDQFLYSITLDSLHAADRIGLPDAGKAFSNDTLSRFIALVRGWQLDTLDYKGGLLRKLGLGSRKPEESFGLEASLVLAPFEEGTIKLPDMQMLLEKGGVLDTLRFSAPELEVAPIQIDTATFVPHDIKGQMRYPLTFRELLPYLALIWLLATVIIALVCIIKTRKRAVEERKALEPPHIVALRSLDRYRGNKYWAPEKQKTMYSGITDTLRTYMEARFDINAEEMTTAEIFDALKDNEDIPADLRKQVKELFELSDFVKFAKMTASEEDNASAVPLAVRFVTSTYQTQLESEAAQEGGDK